MQGDESFGRTSLARGFAILCVALMVVAPARALAAPVETVLHFFTGNGDVSPDAGLIADSDGNFFGTTSGDGQDLGAVFKLSLPATAGGAWTETVLHAFTGGSDGGSPQAGLIADSEGNLYGTTAYGGASRYGGTVFELTPPATAGGAWTETVLYAFTGGSDGGTPVAGVIADSKGNIYGTASVGGSLSLCKPRWPWHGVAGCGTVFKLSPPATAGGAWTETVLYAFTGGSDGATPYAGVIADSKGNLYGTTNAGGASNAGTVFELTPPATAGGAWTETLLHTFMGGSNGGLPQAGVIADSKGNLYGTTAYGGASNAGTVFELTPPATAGGAWTETLLHAFTGGRDGGFPQAGLIADSKGNLYGTTAYGGASKIGTVFKLSPPATAGGAWTETVLSSFNYSDGANPVASLIVDSEGILYGTTSGGGVSCPYVGCGTVFELTDTRSPGVCSPCRSPAICCACAGGIWNGKECS